MSYARWGCDKSNVYVYASTMGGLVCCGCALTDSTTEFSTSGEMVAHLNEHRANNHLVPDYTFREILEDYPDQAAPISGD